MDLPRAVVE